MSSKNKENLHFIRSLVSKSIKMLFHCFLKSSSRIALHLRESLTDIKQSFLDCPSGNPKVCPQWHWWGRGSWMLLSEWRFPVWGWGRCRRVLLLVAGGTKRKRWEQGRLSHGAHSVPGLLGLQREKGVGDSRRKKKLVSGGTVWDLAKAGTLWGPGENAAWRRGNFSSRSAWAHKPPVGQLGSRTSLGAEAGIANGSRDWGAAEGRPGQVPFGDYRQLASLWPRGAFSLLSHRNIWRSFVQGWRPPVSMWGSRNRNSELLTWMWQFLPRLVRPGREVVLHVSSKGAPVSL